MRALPYFLAYLIPLCFVPAALWGGGWLLLVPAFVFVAIPLVDGLVGQDTSDPDGTEGDNPLYDLALRLWVPVQIGVLGLGLWRVTQGVGWLEGAGLAASLGILTAAGGINIAHELMHRKSRVDQGLAEFLMACATYSWFCVEHVQGHHRRVATPDDPATARLGESFYAFLPRSVVGGLVSAWKLEGARIARRGIPVWSLRNAQVRYPLGLVALYALAAGVAGLPGVLLLAGQSLVAIALLEAINYIEHYGLLREVVDGTPVRVQPHHSWNSTFRFTNWYLFNLQRHADHHAWASRPYHQLRAWTGAPELPLGYPAMVLLALVPPAYFAVMNPRVAAVRAGQAAATSPSAA